MKLVHALVVASVLAGFAAPRAQAQTRRLAVIVGSNVGSGTRPPLVFAQEDARKVAQVLVELGEFAPADVQLLADPTASELARALVSLRGRIARWKAGAADGRAVALFYFSGHSDGEALELAGEKLAFRDLRQELGALGADVRLVVLDTCRSGGLLAAKGGRPGPAYDIRLTDDVVATGQVLLTSSAADELALESQDLGGSFFTHHLVSGLRGSADASGDGRVTLAEAYRYAFDRTVSTTADTISGPQHPSYDYRLSGQGDLVLSDLNQPSARLEVPDGFTRALVLWRDDGRVVAELGPGGRRRLSLAPGSYDVRAWRDHEAFLARVTVESGRAAALRSEDFLPAPKLTARAKGSLGEARPPGSLLVAVGGRDAVARDTRLGTSRLSWTVGNSHLALDVASGRGAAFREWSALVVAGVRKGWRLGSVTIAIGAEAGGGAVWQAVDDGRVDATPAAAAGPWLGVSKRLAPRISIALEGHAPLVLLRRDGATTASLHPGTWLGLALDL